MAAIGVVSLLVIPACSNHAIARVLALISTGSVMNENRVVRPYKMIPMSNKLGKVSSNRIPPSNTQVTHLDEKLTIYMTEIEVFYKGESVGFVQITVDHAGGEITPVNNHGHGQICEGCGVICKNEDHDVPYWVPDDNAGLLTSETETGTCSICGDTVSRYIEGTATYPNVFYLLDVLMPENDVEKAYMVVQIFQIVSCVILVRRFLAILGVAGLLKMVSFWVSKL